jgi:hypothetical protein
MLSYYGFVENPETFILKKQKRQARPGFPHRNSHKTPVTEIFVEGNTGPKHSQRSDSIFKNAEFPGRTVAGTSGSTGNLFFRFVCRDAGYTAKMVKRVQCR